MPDPGSTPPHARRGDWLAAAGLALAVALFYGRCATFAFTNWDDIPLLTDNPLTRTPGLETALALLRPGAVPQEHLYIPLTYLSHWLENALFGIQPAVVHSVNVFLHTLNAALVFGLGRRLGASRPAATLAALLFALHPLQVEAVAWGMGRKDLLATAFALAALLAWCRWRDDGRHRWYALGVGAWALSLLAKPATIVLPGVFVLLDLCRGRRVTACWRPQVPTLVIGVLVLVVNLGLGKEITGKVPLIERLAAIPPVIHGWVARLALAEAPSAFYPWPPPEFSLRLVSGCLVVAGLAAAITIAWRRRQPEWWLGLGFAALTFLPAIGIVISYRKFVTADRYGYLPFVGVALAVALVLTAAVGRHRLVLSVLAALWVTAAAGRAWPVVGHWRDSVTLWEQVIQQGHANQYIWLSLGDAYETGGRQPDALEAYQTAVRLDPQFAAGWRHLGAALLRANNPSGAINAAERALTDPAQRPKALQTLGGAYFSVNAYPKALQYFEEQAALTPDDPQVHYHLALTCAKLEQPDQVEVHLRRAAELGHAEAAAKLRAFLEQRPAAQPPTLEPGTGQIGR